MPALVVELHAQLLAGELVAVAGEPREGELVGDALGQRPHPRRLLGQHRRADHRPDRDERERHAVDLGVLGREQVVFGVR